MYDAVIIGLGPAGATLSRLLNDKLKVAAIDKKHTAGKDGFMKPCGGLLAADAQKSLAKFNITLPKEVLVDPQIFSVRTIDLKTNLIRHYQRFYINLDRHKFDLWLKALIPENVDVFNNSQCTAIEKCSEGFSVRFKTDGQEKMIYTKYIIGADGANSIVRRTFYPEIKMHSYISIQQWFSEAHSKPFYSCIFDPENTDCYSWTISKDGYFIFGGAFPSKNARQRFENQKKKLEQIGMKFGQALKTEACLVLRPHSLKDFCCGNDNIFFIGEAAGFISPSSLEGISSAMNSAYYLSRVLNSQHADPNRKYKAMTLKLRLKLYFKVLKCPFMYYSPLRKLVMKSGVKNITLADEFQYSKFI